MEEHVVDPSKYITVPPGVALCPQCGNELVVWIDEWETETGTVTENGFTVECSSDEEDGDGEHQYWYDEWIRIDQIVYRWLSNAVRVEDG